MANLRKHFMYGAWAGMVNRCHNPNNSSYATYGALGINVCERWRCGEDGKIGFACFLEDMGERPDGMTLDRIKATGNYEPGNCRWATPMMQRQNLSSHGKRELSRKISEAKTASWGRWRANNTHRPEISPFCQKRLHALAGGPQTKPSDGREVRSFESLVRIGMAVLRAGEYEITDAGVAWLNGGRPQMRAV